MNDKYKYCIVGRYIQANDNYWTKFNKYKTLESAYQALFDMTKNITGCSINTYELKIVPYFTGLYIPNLKFERKIKLNKLFQFIDPI